MYLKVYFHLQWSLLSHQASCLCCTRIFWIFDLQIVHISAENNWLSWLQNNKDGITNWFNSWYCFRWYFTPFQILSKHVLARLVQMIIKQMFGYIDHTDIFFFPNLTRSRCKRLLYFVCFKWTGPAHNVVRSSVDTVLTTHDDVIKWKHFPHYWPFVQGIHRSPVNSPHKDQWREALMFSLMCALNKRLSKQLWGWWFETIDLARNGDSGCANEGIEIILGCAISCIACAKHGCTGGWLILCLRRHCAHYDVIVMLLLLS